MVYGIIVIIFLFSVGVMLVVVSVSVYIVEVFIIGFFGIFYVKFGNVNKLFFFCLLLLGMIGVVFGVVLIICFDGYQFKFFIFVYLLLMGLYILSKVYCYVIMCWVLCYVVKLVFFGGFVDVVGGGGWGLVVISSLIGLGSDLCIIIGLVNFVEFFLIIVSVIFFIFFVGQLDIWKMVVGLVFGGLFVVLFVVLLCKKFLLCILLVIVGILIILISVYNIYIGLC